MKRFDVEWSSGSKDYDKKGEFVSVKDVKQTMKNYVSNGGSPSFAKEILEDLEIND